MYSKIVYPNVIVPAYRAHDVSTVELALEFAVNFGVDLDVVYRTDDNKTRIQFPEYVEAYEQGTEMWAIVQRKSGLVIHIEFNDDEDFEENWKDTP